MLACSSSPRSQAPDEDRRLLSEAGYPEGKGFPQVLLTIHPTGTTTRLSTSLIERWNERLGVEIHHSIQDWKGLLAAADRGEYEILRRAWVGEVPDPVAFLDLMRKGNPFNTTGWSNAEYEDCLDRAAREQDAAARTRLLQRAEEILLDELPVIPLYFFASQNLYRDREVTGIYQNWYDLHPLNEVAKGSGSGVLVLNNGGEVDVFDSAQVREVSEERIVVCLFEGLVRPDPRTLAPVPGIAERWEISGDGLRYVFHLREAAWSDGEPVRARDFEYAWKRILDPSTESPSASALFVLAGAEEFHKGTGDASSVGVAVQDDRTLVVRLRAPVPYFLELASRYPLHPARSDAVWSDTVVANGPFRLVEHVPSKHILLAKNDRYWNAASVKQELVRWLPIDDPDRALELYERGDCDYLETVSPESLARLRGRSDFHSTVTFGTAFLMLNVRGKPFDDKRVRQAFSRAIHRERLCREALGGGGIPAYHLVPPTLESRGYRSPQ